MLPRTGEGRLGLKPAVFMRDRLRGLMNQVGFQDTECEMGRLYPWSLTDLFLNY